MGKGAIILGQQNMDSEPEPELEPEPEPELELQREQPAARDCLQLKPEPGWQVAGGQGPGLQQWRRCHNCGEFGHLRSQCTFVGSCEKGRAARKQDRGFRHKQAGLDTDKPSLPAWLPAAGDPVAQAIKQGTQRARKDLAHAAREHFGAAIDHIAGCLPQYLQPVDESERAVLNGALRVALRSGVHCRFDNDAGLAAYTHERLKARCMYLHALLLSEDPHCTVVRQLLLPPPSGTNHAAPSVSVLSIGGGPGYDDVALRIVVDFLSRCNGVDSCACGPIVSTTVLDLYKNWAAPVAAVVSANLPSGTRRR